MPIWLNHTGCAGHPRAREGRDTGKARIECLVGRLCVADIPSCGGHEGGLDSAAMQRGATVDHVSSPALEPTKLPPPRSRIETLRLLRTIVRNPIDAWPIEIYSEPFVRAHFLGRDVAFVRPAENRYRKVIVRFRPPSGRPEIELTTEPVGQK